MVKRKRKLLEEMMPKFGPVEGSRLSKSRAEKCGNAIYRLIEEIGEGITTSDVVEASKSRKTQPDLHEEFDWDNELAADKWRHQQAGYLLRSINVVYSEDFQEPIRAFVDISPAAQTTEHLYVHVKEALSDKETRALVIGKLTKELKSFQLRLRRYEEFSNVVVAIRKHLKKAA